MGALPRALSASDGIHLSADTNHSLAVRPGGTVWAWGWNGNGQLGDDTITHRLQPVPVLGLTEVVAVSAGSAHSLVLLFDGTVRAWGGNESGQLGDGTTLHRLQSAPHAFPASPPDPSTSLPFPSSPGSRSAPSSRGAAACSLHPPRRAARTYRPTGDG
ncbi:RCC1 domain-containing protein [Stigmatella ashevillensis]|uniref:RCC1 domain-containing protein n=1 Tax=Stigmatella ashevillensis TaxID=2995309 RepID=UPI00280AB5DC|nr:hypothetical protein [Stigmatella ashevillena]